MLDRDLEEAEDQFGMALRAHLQNMDKLIDLQDSRLLGLEQEFEGELAALEKEFNSERKQVRVCEERSDELTRSFFDKSMYSANAFIRNIATVNSATISNAFITTPFATRFACRRSSASTAGRSRSSTTS